MSRDREAHYSIDVEREGRWRWRWNVAFSPEAYEGYNGTVYPPMDHVGDGVSLTEKRARRAARRSIDAWERRERWASESTREVVRA